MTWSNKLYIRYIHHTRHSPPSAVVEVTDKFRYRSAPAPPLGRVRAFSE